MRLLALVLALSAAASAEWELGGAAGYGVYKNGSVISTAGTVDAGIRNRFALGAIIGEDLYRHIGGEIRYLYQDGDPFVSSGGQRSNVQGQSHAFHYNLLVHFREQGSRVRPFVAGGVGAKWFVTTQAPPVRQPLDRIAILSGTNQVRALVVVGGGLKYDVRPHLRLRVELYDYITPFPNRIIVPAPGATARGIFHQFTPLIGITGFF